MIEKLCDWHKNKTNIFLHIIALIILIYGVWIKNWMWMAIALVVAGLGHAIQSLTSEKAKPKRRK